MLKVFENNFYILIPDFFYTIFCKQKATPIYRKNKRNHRILEPNHLGNSLTKFCKCLF